MRTVFGKASQHPTGAYLTKRLEQDHRAIKGRIRCMRAFKTMARPATSVASMPGSGTSLALVAVTNRSSPLPLAAPVSKAALIWRETT